ncbi:MAG TPA: NUDIX hydrolase [Propionibacteriaceae bacterium]
METDWRDHMRWVVFGERTLYDNPWVRLVKVDVEPPNGKRFEHHVVRLQRVAVAAVLDDQDRVLMLWRHRFVTDEWGWELPGGIVDDGEDGAGTAAREVEEETGWRPGPMTHLLTFQPMIGMVDSPHELFFAQGAEHIGDPTDLEEAGRVDWLPLASILDMMSKGEILGSGSLVALLHVLASRNAA